MKIAFIVSWIILAAFLIAAIVLQNPEFFFYSVILLMLIALLHWSDKKINYIPEGIWGFNIWLLAHLLGGLLRVGDTALYGAMIYPIVGEPYHILKYDQVIHVFAYIVFGLLVYSLVKKIVKARVPKVPFLIIVFLAAIGIGAINEVLEFLAVVMWPDNNGVGGYFNTGLDMVANTIGAFIAIIYLYFKK